MCSPSAPPAPQMPSPWEQSQANINTARATNVLNNPDVITPYGKTTFTTGDTVDQAGYDKALAEWEAAQNQPRSSWIKNYQTKVKPTIDQFTTLGRDTMTQTLSPEEQALYGKQMENKYGVSSVAQQGIDAASGIIGQNVDYSGAINDPSVYSPSAKLNPSGRPESLDPNSLSPMPQSGEATRQRVIDAMMSRSNTDIGQQSDQTNSDLIARGIRPGTEAYSREQDALNRRRNDARMQAEIAGGNAAAQQYGMDLSTRQLGAGEQAQKFGQDLSSGAQDFQQQLAATQQSQGEQQQQYGQTTNLRRQQIAEMLAKRQIPLNEITALMSGSQTANPFAGQGFQAGATVAPTDLMAGPNMLNQYNMNAYNQSQAQRNALIGGAASLGGAALMASDRRLKTDIERIGTHKLGIGLYKWTYLWGEKSTGVMADELEKVMPKAVLTNPFGFKMVNYSMLEA